MRRRLTDAEVIGACGGILVAMAVAGILGSVRPIVDQANAGLVLVLVVVGAAVVGGRWAGGATALAAAVSFDFFLTRPYLSLAIKSQDDIITTGLLFLVGVSVGHLASRRWEAERRGRAGTAEVAGMFRVATLAADGAQLADVLTAVEREIAAVLDLDGCRFEPTPTDPPVPVLQPNGRIDAPYVHVGDGFVLPAEGIKVAVRSGGRLHGWLVGAPRRPLVGVSTDRRLTAVVLADQLGLVLSQGDASYA